MGSGPATVKPGVPASGAVAPSLLFLQLLPPRRRGARAKARGTAPSRARCAGRALGTRRGSPGALCRAVCLGVAALLSLVPVPLIPCPLVCQLGRKSRSRPPVAALPVCPVCLEPAPGAARAPGTRNPPFAGLLAALWVRFLTEDPLELRWEGGALSSQKRPHHPKGRNISVEGFPLWTLDIGASFSFVASFWLACSLACLGSQGPSQTNSPANGLGGAHQHPFFRRLCELVRARGPDLLCPPPHKGQIHARLSLGLEGDPGVRVPLGLRHRLTAPPQGSRVPSRPLAGGGLGEVCVLGSLVATVTPHFL
ncbi:uncharacterized protein LOC117999915 [Mirounga leonina]|uniref:uncharacterized protein LOC117999915 n=1 Tax=Mirounga leonina TaxID=9715 RepID=UPI00156BE5EA|nr:uncharacterized protein LOC117999915 [Mirounga leonina]